MSFEREERYVVVKIKDMTYNQREALKRVLGDWRIPTRECVVVESDWPEYETVWDMIQGRVEGEEAERIRQDMVAENNRIAAQSDATYGDNSIMQFDDIYQAIAFRLYKQAD